MRPNIPYIRATPEIIKIIREVGLETCQSLNIEPKVVNTDAVAVIHANCLIKMGIEIDDQDFQKIVELAKVCSHVGNVITVLTALSKKEKAQEDLLSLRIRPRPIVTTISDKKRKIRMRANNEPKNELGRRIIQQRMRQQKSQTVAAQEAGIKPDLFRQIERGEVNPIEDDMRKIEDWLTPPALPEVQYRVTDEQVSGNPE